MFASVFRITFKLEVLTFLFDHFTRVSLKTQSAFLFEPQTLRPYLEHYPSRVTPSFRSRFHFNSRYRARSIIKLLKQHTFYLLLPVHPSALPAALPRAVPPGSYPGSLAAWFRLKYPHLVSGKIAIRSDRQFCCSY